jgi:hypothetical protein
MTAPASSRFSALNIMTYVAVLTNASMIAFVGSRRRGP